MAELTICPHCGALLPPDPEVGRAVTVAGDDDAFPEDDVDAAAVSLLASGSNDDNFRFNPARSQALGTTPDPILGAFVPPPAAPAPSKSRDVFPAIDFNVPTASGKSKLAASVAADDLFEDEPPPRAGWPTVLLASYASATTLALAWLLISQRGRESRGIEPPPVPADTRADPGRQARLSRVIEPPPPVPEDRIANLGQAIQVGSLDILPVAIRRQDVVLQRVDVAGKSEQRVGGKDAYLLRLRLQNTSKDAIFAPLDQGFVRERGGAMDSFIETSRGTKIYPYPLALESELSIVGQDFAALRPGESRIVTIASAADAPADDPGPYLWRLLLRTGIDQTEAIGVRWAGPPARPAAAKK